MDDAPTSSHPSKRPPRQSRKGVTSTGARKAASKSARSRSRDFALQALYQYRVGGGDVAEIDAFTRALVGFHKCDAPHYHALLAPKLDRPMQELSPIEHICMWIGAYELQHALDVPWRVVMNEAIELAKEFGGTDGHKYVNGILDALAPALRPAEVQASPGMQAAKAATAPVPDTDTNEEAPAQPDSAA